MTTDAAVVTPGAPDLPLVDGIERESIEETVKRAGWFPRLMRFYLRRRYAPGKAPKIAHDPRRATERAHAVIRRACALSAASGVTVGAISTGAAIFTAETEGLATFVTLPTAAITIGGEMVLRAYVHLSLTCDLADIFGVRIDPDDPSDIWRLYALTFKTEKHTDSEDPGQELVHRVVHVEGEEVGEQIGRHLVGESVLRNIMPVASLATSSVTNWRMTRRVGDTIRRYMRYHRAITDALAEAEGRCHAELDLLVEGCWYIFTADGRLHPEEAAILANLLRAMPVIERALVIKRFGDDEYEWAERIQSVPEETRDAFLRALEVAAAVDKSVSAPERKILRRASRKLGRAFDGARVEKMMRDFESYGVIGRSDDA